VEESSQLDDSEIHDAGDVFDVELDEDMGVGVLTTGSGPARSRRSWPASGSART
jgi:hypothetical protein